MTGTNADTRVVRTLTTGSKICLLLAIPFLVGAAYFYFTPIVVQLGGTSLFSCGSRFNPPTDAFKLSQCTDLYTVYGARSGACLALGLMIAAVGVGLFGFSTRTEKRADILSAS
ncbi:hypothetical protein [Aeromicrobium wangtongii]|uniref:Sugar ABC transporter permease n=1 Tax=Aeromicrobium wangtongii TaxID=2969247 RepID=A0ABY5MDV1_9ACTN|nr:hypothetical protein [Aeromicrobium wangtongii]MCD9197615.1 hypothetical protein [Aeromicrobium wangtongii]UUP15104.1 hypothetical protein NQV15_07270 [Aeromicrobium wangtongii]